MLPASPQVYVVYRESIIPSINKLSAADARNTLCIDSTTLDLQVARDVAEGVNATGASMVDAPVSGGNKHFLARAERLTFARGDRCQSRHFVLPRRRYGRGI